MTKIRTTRRARVISFVKIISELNRSLMGRVIDLSSRGIRVRSKIQYELNKPFNFSVLFPNINFREKIVKLDASVVWSRPSVLDGYYESGLHIESVSPKDKSIIEQFIQDSTHKNKWNHIDESFNQEY